MTEQAVTTVDAGTRQVARRVEVNAAPADVFALVADPRRHAEFDGSGTVRDAVSAPEQMADGAKFSVRMKMYGVPYKITSTVIAYEPDKIFEWRHPLGHSWRYEITEIAPGTSQVTETFNYSTAKAPKMLELIKVPAQNGDGISKTLEKLRTRFAN